MITAVITAVIQVAHMIMMLIWLRVIGESIAAGDYEAAIILYEEVNINYSPHHPHRTTHNSPY